MTTKFHKAVSDNIINQQTHNSTKVTMRNRTMRLLTLLVVIMAATMMTTVAGEETEVTTIPHHPPPKPPSGSGGGSSGGSSSGGGGGGGSGGGGGGGGVSVCVYEIVVSPDTDTLLFSFQLPTVACCAQCRTRQITT